MEVHAFDIARIAASPWKNGGGVTRELVCWPAGADMNSFDWRVSIAEIHQSGPFSRFEGIDRIIMLLSGDGVRLRSPAGDVSLSQPWQPFSFAGEASIECSLLGGRSTDFNVMTRRTTLRANLAALHQSCALPTSAAGLLLAASGHWRVSHFRHQCLLDPGQGLWWTGAMDESPWRIALESTASAALVAVSISPRR